MLKDEACDLAGSLHVVDQLGFFSGGRMEQSHIRNLQFNKKCANISNDLSSIYRKLVYMLKKKP